MDLINKMFTYAYHAVKFALFGALFVGLSISQQCSDEIWDACRIVTFDHYCK